MIDYVVSYYLGNFFHCYTIEAETEVDAMIKALERIPETSKKWFHDIKIKRKKGEWN